WEVELPPGPVTIQPLRGEVVDPFAVHDAVRVDLPKSGLGFRQQFGQAIHIRPVGVGMVVPYIVTREHLLRDLVQLKIAETITLEDAPRGLEKVASVRVAGTDLVVEHLAVARGGRRSSDAPNYPRSTDARLAFLRP